MLKIIDHVLIWQRQYPEGFCGVTNEVLREISKFGIEMTYDVEQHRVKMLKLVDNVFETNGDLIDLAKKTAEALFKKYSGYDFVNMIRALNDDKIYETNINLGGGYYFRDVIANIGLTIKLNTLLYHPARQNDDVSEEVRTEVHNFYNVLSRTLYDLAIEFEREQGYSVYGGYEYIKPEDVVTGPDFDPMKYTQAFLSSKCEFRATSNTITKDKDETNKNTNIKINNNKPIKEILKQDNKIDLNELKSNKAKEKKKPKVKTTEYRDIIFVHNFRDFFARKDPNVSIEWHKLPDVVQDTAKIYYKLDISTYNKDLINSIIGIDKFTGKYLIRLGETSIPRPGKDTPKPKKFVPNNGKPANFYMAASKDIFNRDNILPSNCRPKYSDLPENIKIFIEQHVGMAIDIGIDKNQQYVIYIGNCIMNKEAIQLNGILVTKDERSDAYEPVDISDENNIPFKIHEFKGFEGCTCINLYTSFETPSTVQYADIGEVGKGGEMRFMFDTAGDEAMDLTSCRTIILPIKYSKIKAVLGKIGAF